MREDSGIVNDLLRLNAQTAQALSMAQRQAQEASTAGRRESWKVLARHAKGMQCALALLRQQVEHGT